MKSPESAQRSTSKPSLADPEVGSDTDRTRGHEHVWKATPPGPVIGRCDCGMEVTVPGPRTELRDHRGVLRGPCPKCGERDRRLCDCDIDNRDPWEETGGVEEGAEPLCPSCYLRSGRDQSMAWNRDTFEWECLVCAVNHHPSKQHRTEGAENNEE